MDKLNISQECEEYLEDQLDRHEENEIRFIFEMEDEVVTPFDLLYKPDQDLTHDEIEYLKSLAEHFKMKKTTFVYECNECTCQLTTQKKLTERNCDCGGIFEFINEKVEITKDTTGSIEDEPKEEGK